MGQGLLDDVFSGEEGVAALLIDLFGEPATLRHIVDGTYTAKTGIETGATTVDDLVDASPPEPYKVNDIDGETIRKGDRWTIVPAHQITLELIPEKFQMIVNGRTYLGISFEPIKSGLEVAAYTIQLRN